MTEQEFNAVLMDLRTNTPLGRVNHDESVVVFDRLRTLGFDWREWTASTAALEAGRVS